MEEYEPFDIQDVTIFLNLLPIIRWNEIYTRPANNCAISCTTHLENWFRSEQEIASVTEVYQHSFLLRCPFMTFQSHVKRHRISNKVLPLVVVFFIPDHFEETSPCPHAFFPPTTTTIFFGYRGSNAPVLSNLKNAVSKTMLLQVRLTACS